MILVDTSALFAVLNASDENHPAAARVWRQLLSGSHTLVSTNYVLVETCSLVQHRLGMAAVRALQDNLVPALRIHWIDENLHNLATVAMLAAARRKLSLVDCSTFVIMRHLGIRHAFAFDQHFVEEGATLPPDSPA